MRPRSLGVAAAFAASLLFCIPALAQDTTHAIRYDEVGFVMDDSLGSSVDITQVPGQPTSLEQPMGPEPPHLAFTLYGPRAEDRKIPRPADSPSVVRFYRVADLAGYDAAERQLDSLSTLLDTRPDLAGYEAIAADGTSQPLPFLPVFPAAQVIDARAHYVDTPQVSGVAYVTAFRQDVSPFAADDFWYTFQGLSADGSWYVAADFVVSANMFPETLSAKDAQRLSSAEKYTAYLEQSVQALDAASAEDFDPSPAVIDALVQSIAFEGVPATEPSPQPAAG